VTATIVKPEACILLHDTLLTPGSTDDACLRLRFAKDGNLYVGVGKPTRTSRDRRTTKFSYVRHSIESEQKHPAGFTAGRRMTLTVRYQASSGNGSLQVDDGPTLELTTARILGLSHIGLAVTSGGVLRLRSIHTKTEQL
jgi:hypothetical protein